MLALRRVLFAVVTDEDWSRVSGLPVGFVNNVLAVLTAVAVVAAMRIVGILLIAAMMVLPVASGQMLARSFRFHAPVVDRGQRGLGDRGVGRLEDLGDGAGRHDRPHRGRGVRGRRGGPAERGRPPARDGGGGPMMAAVPSDLHATIETRLRAVGSAIHAEASGPGRHAAARGQAGLDDRRRVRAVRAAAELRLPEPRGPGARGRRAARHHRGRVRAVRADRGADGAPPPPDLLAAAAGSRT